MGNGQTERSGENRLMTTTFVGRDFEETRKTGEVLRKPRKQARFVRNQETWGENMGEV